MRAEADWPLGVRRLRRWADELDAALKADTEALCECPNDKDMVDACERFGANAVTFDGRCVICNRKVKVTT